MEGLLSLCMIVKDEEKALARALRSVREYVDEIVIVDTGSTDRTKEIASEFTHKIFDFEWNDDFSAARNFSFSKAECKYVMWMDADDVVTPENGALLSKLRRRLLTEEPDVVMCRYDVAFDNSGRTTYSYIRERILRRENCPPWTGCVHECITPYGKIIFSHFTVRHGEVPGKIRGRRNLDIYQKNIAAGVKLDSRHMFYYGRELYSNRLYAEAVAVLEQAVEGEGWFVNKIEASKVLADCYIAQGKTENAMKTLLWSFRFGEPRAAVLCKLGSLFKREKKWKEAIYWYTAALSAKDFSVCGDFDQPEYRTIIPLIELTACYWQDGEEQKAVQCHKTAAELQPDHPSVVFNEEFFKGRGLL